MKNWEEFGRKRPWPNFKVISWHSLERLRKITKASFRTAGLRAEI
jgi:hypothetical protein